MKMSEQTPKTEKLQKVTTSPLDVSVYRTETKKVEKLPLEDYLVGVVAAEMPATFELKHLRLKVWQPEPILCKL